MCDFICYDWWRPRASSKHIWSISLRNYINHTQANTQSIFCPFVYSQLPPMSFEVSWLCSNSQMLSFLSSIAFKNWNTSARWSWAPSQLLTEVANVSSFYRFIYSYLFIYIFIYIVYHLFILFIVIILYYDMVWLEKWFFIYIWGQDMALLHITIIFYKAWKLSLERY